MSVKCLNCDSENTDSARFCSDCGTQLGPLKDIPGATKTLLTPIKRLSLGTLFANRYEILEELGKGGMGEVYRVRDKKLDEDMALKVLKPEIAAYEETIDRFKNELKLAHKIAHRNVCKMYDLHEEGETPFITMEYVKGEDLKKLIKKKEKLAEKEAIAIAKQVCEGLAEAHELGVIHRDLKPQNIMINEKGTAKVMDFGIARSIEAAGVTQTGVIIGTPDYISPEQADGEQADQRSDIYSLGVILYEMATGKVPFKGDTALSVALKHKAQLPPDPKKLNPDISEDLSRVILICMEKDRERRYQTAEALLSDLRNIEDGLPLGTKIRPRQKTFAEALIRKKLFIPALTIIVLAIVAIMIWQIIHQKRMGPTGAGKPSVAVLPFEDLSPQKDQGYLCDGFAESLINALIKIKDLRVPAPTSSFSFRSKEKNIREIGEKLNVKTVLRGSVQKAGNKVGIIAQLINVEDESLLWSEQYNREMDDVFAIQEEINLAIVDKLQIELLGGEKEKLVKRYTENPEAYNLYLKGRYFWNKRTEEDIKKAIEYFEQAVEKDPNYAMAYVGLADSYAVLPDYSDIPQKDVNQKIKEAVHTALNIDNTLTEAITTIGNMKLYNLEWEGAEKELMRAIELNPGYARAHFNYAHYFMCMAQFDEAIKEMKRALELDPLSLVIHRSVGVVYFYARQYDKAIEALKKTIEMDPNFPFVHSVLGMAYTQESMFKEALAEFQKEESPGWLAISYLRMGRKDEAQNVLEDLLRRSKKTKNQLKTIADIYFALGENDHGFEWLERVSEKHPNMGMYLKIDPVFDSARSDPWFKELLKKKNLE